MGFQTLKIVLWSLPVAVLSVSASAAAPTENTGSFLREYTWESSFDKAGDASGNAARALKAMNLDCSAEGVQLPGATPEQIKARIDQCEHAKAEAQKYAAEANSIQNTQYIMADVSRVSDVAAVGAIGAVGYAELVKKKKGQANTYNSAAKIQETAGYVSYATGAADFSMGAYAYLAQKSKLEQMQKTLSGISMNASDQQAVSQLNAAAEQTKKAAYSHMLYGAGKAAVGYASMELAKRNRKQAANMDSIDMTQYTTPVATASSSGATVSGGAAYYQNNTPQFTMPDGTLTTPSTNSDGSGAVFTGASGGASVMPESRGLASVNPGAGIGGGGSGGGSAGGKTGGAPAGDPLVAAKEETKEEAAADALNSFELNLAGGGGGSRYGGGSKDSHDEGGGMAGLLGGLMGGAPPTSNATGLNPNSVYKDAMVGLEGHEQGSMAGVSGSTESLFAVVKSKYNKMMEGGRLQGPGAVEVRN